MTYKTLPVWLGISIFYGLGLVWRPAYGVGGGILLLTALLAAREWRSIIDKERRVIAFLMLIFLLFALPLLYHQAAGREYDRFTRLLGIIPIFLLFSRRPLTETFWAATLSTGAIIALLAALCADTAGRFGGAHHPIQFGDLALLTGFLALAIHRPWSKNILSLLVGSGFCAGVAASFLSGSRGGWVTLLPLLTFFYFHLFSQPKKRWFVLGFVMLGGAIFAFPSVTERLLAIWQNLTAFWQGNSNTSIGLRFEMWHLAGQLFVEKPFLGWGSAGLQEALTQLFLTNHFPINAINHLHNDFLDTAARFGCLGLSGLLLLYFLPLGYFFSQWRRGIYPAGAGVVLCTCFILFSCTQSILRHQSGVMFYLITGAILYHLTARASRF